MVRLANVLQHSHGDKSVKVPAHVAVIVLNELYLSVEPFVFGALPGKSELLAGNIEGLDLHAIVSGHVQAQSSPSAAGFHNLFSRTQPQLARHQIQLGPLRFFQVGVLLREIGAGVDHLRIEPEPVKIIGEIVMIVDIAARTAQAVRLRQIKPSRIQLRRPFPRDPIQTLEQSNQVAFHHDSAFRIEIAEIHLRIAQQRDQRTAVFDPNRGDGGR